MKWVVAIYNKYNGRNDIKVVEASSDIDAIQIAVEGQSDTSGVSVEHLIGYYWKSRNIVVSEPELLT